MANVKITGLTAVATVVPGTDVVPIINGGTTKKATVDQLVSKSLNAGGIVVDAIINGVTVGMGLASVASNTAVGRTALSANTTGAQNSAMGMNALQFNTTGNYNSAMGRTALQNNTTGDANSAMGQNALQFNTTGNYNSAMGQSALFSNTTGYQNSAVGRYALFNNTTGTNNSAMGVSALQSNTTGYQNTSVGTSTLQANTTGYNNLAMGLSALASNTTGFQNSVMGLQTLLNNTTGYQNSAVGVNALLNNTTGYNNVAVGANSLYDARPTSKAITAFADYSATVAGTVKATSVAHGLTGATAKTISGTVNYDGAYTVTVIDVDNFYFTKAPFVITETGWWSIVTEGNNNTALGYNTGRGIITGAGNTIIGANVIGLASTLTNNIILANGAGGIRYRSDATNTTISENVIITGDLYTKSPTPTALITAGANTLTIAQLLTNIITVTQAAAVTLTLPTGALVDGGITSLPVNQAFDWNVINLGSSAGAITMAVGTTHTYVGNLTIAIGTSAQFRTQKTAATTFVTYRIA